MRLPLALGGRSPLASLIAGACLLTGAVAAQQQPSPFGQGRELSEPGAVLPHRQRVEVVNRLLKERLEELLPVLMREAGIDLWLVINREYAEDPVYLTLVPEPVFAARRTTMLLFFDRGPERGVERLTVSRYPLADLYEAAWEGGDLDEQWQRLAELVAERRPERIAIDSSRDWPVADGLTASLHERLLEVLPERLRSRVVSAEELVVRWLETRTAGELELYPHVVALARGVIAEAFSERVVTPGATTTDDVAWYIRHRFEDLELRPWFQPYVNIQRRGTPCREEDPFCGIEGLILEGDVLHTDVGICYLRLCTDTQEMGYVLRLGEERVPEDLERALAIGNRWQDLLTGSFADGRSGNEILRLATVRAAEEGIEASIYTHPLGFFGHAPGPTIGMWDNQGPTAVRGDWPLHPSTAFAIEGNVRAPVASWGESAHVRIKLEQSAVWDGESVLYLAGRQTAWHVVE